MYTCMHILVQANPEHLFREVGPGLVSIKGYDNDPDFEYPTPTSINRYVLSYIMTIFTC